MAVVDAHHPGVGNCHGASADGSAEADARIHGCDSAATTAAATRTAGDRPGDCQIAGDARGAMNVERSGGRGRADADIHRRRAVIRAGDASEHQRIASAHD